MEKSDPLKRDISLMTLVIDTMEDSWVPLTAEERLERFCYIGMTGTSEQDL